MVHLVDSKINRQLEVNQRYRCLNGWVIKNNNIVEECVTTITNESTAIVPSLFALSLRPEIELIKEDDTIVLQSLTHRLIFHCSPGLQVALNCLKYSKNTAAQLKQLIAEVDGVEREQEFNAYLIRLMELGWVCHSVLSIATAIPMSEEVQFICPYIDWQQESFTLSRFAYLHQVNGTMVLESSVSKTKIILQDWRGAALVAKLSQPQTCTTLLSEVPELTKKVVQQFIRLLLATQMLSTGTESAHLVFWEFHDLLFHSRSRMGRHDNPVGGTYRSFGELEPLPGIKPPMSSEMIKLYRPNPEELATTDISLTQALESRRSIRQFGDRPITVKQLGEVLYRCARVKKIIETEMGELSQRPYPSGGGIYELEIYPIIHRCEGLESGLYHYEPLEHGLCRVSEWNQAVEAIMTDAWFTTGQQGKPQVLLSITARFGRLFWKYQSMAYAAILKNVGVLYQSLYLITTGMNLASSALGSGNSDLFAKASGIDYCEETSVGEFMLGSRK